MNLFDTLNLQPEQGLLRHDWTLDEILKLLEKPLIDLLWKAQQVHRAANPNGYT